MANWKKDYLRYRSIFSNILRSYNSRPDLKIFLELFLTLATATIFTIFALKPTIVTIINLYKEIQTKEATIEKMDSKINNLTEAQNTLIKEQANIEMLNQAIPDLPLPEKSSAQLIGLSQYNQVSLNSLSMNDIPLLGDKKSKAQGQNIEALPSGASSTDIGFALNSDFDKLYKTFIDIENMRRPIKIDSFVFNTSSPKENSEAQNFLLTIIGRLPQMVKE